jgi:hypothetical protein
MDKVVLGIVDTPEAANVAVERLRVMGYPPSEVALLYPDKHGTHDFGFEQHSKAAEGALVGAGLGAIVGGLIGIAAGLRVLVMPGLERLTAAGPLLAALSCAAVLALVLAVVGALIGSGVPAIEAKHYAGKVRRGSILVAVHVTRRSEMRRARDVLKSIAADVTTTTEAPVPNAARA